MTFHWVQALGFAMLQLSQSLILLSAFNKTALGGLPQLSSAPGFSSFPAKGAWLSSVGGALPCAAATLSAQRASANWQRNWPQWLVWRKMWKIHVLRFCGKESVPAVSKTNKWTNQNTQQCSLVGVIKEHVICVRAEGVSVTQGWTWWRRRQSCENFRKNGHPTWTKCAEGFFSFYLHRLFFLNI